MGWTYTHKGNLTSVKSFFEDQFNFTKENGTYGKILDCKSTINTAYIAYETGNSEKSEVIGIVCLLNRRKEYYNFGYKDMDESMGPNEDHCPVSILNLLSPTTNEWANEWRARCYNNLEKNACRKSLEAGDKIKFERTFGFSRYGKTDTFIVVNLAKGHYYAPALGINVKLTKSNLSDNPWKKI